MGNNEKGNHGGDVSNVSINLGHHIQLIRVSNMDTHNMYIIHPQSNKLYLDFSMQCADTYKHI